MCGQVCPVPVRLVKLSTYLPIVISNAANENESCRLPHSASRMIYLRMSLPVIQLCETLAAARIRLPMPADEPVSHLEIDLAAVAGNVRALRSMLHQPGPGGRPPAICAVVKKNGYGVGAVSLSHRLVREGCQMLAVYDPDEAAELVRGGLVAPILLLMPLRSLKRTDVLYRHAVARRLHLTIHDPGQVGEVNQIGQTFGIKLPIHIYLDTGMSRAGVNQEQLATILGRLNDTRHVELAGLYSHLATADSNPDFAREQFERFQAVIAEHTGQLPRGMLQHLANTFGTFRAPAFHLDMVRPGLGLLGYGPELMSGPMIGDAPSLRHAVRWISRLIHVQRYPRWTPVGYGSTHRLRRESVLGIVPVGYGDGYPVSLSNQASVRVHPADERLPINDAPVLGRVNMDQLIVDLTDVAGEDLGALINSPVEVISNDPSAPNSLPNLAHLAGTHCYELLCRLSPKLHRRYLHS